jgi:hypothetical protein
MASGRVSCFGCLERDQELLHLRRVAGQARSVGPAVDSVRVSWAVQGRFTTAPSSRVASRASVRMSVLSLRK